MQSFQKMVWLEFALMEDELLIKWEVWEGRPGGEICAPQGCKGVAGGQRPAGETARKSVWQK